MRPEKRSSEQRDAASSFEACESIALTLSGEQATATTRSLLLGHSISFSLTLGLFYYCVYVNWTHILWRVRD